VSSHIAAVVLAAGTSSRMQGRNKLLCEVDGVIMIERAVRAAAASRCTQVLVVTGWQADHVEAALEAVPASIPIKVVRNPQYATGMASSLRCAVSALPESTAAALVQLGDMPWIGAAHIDRLIEVFDPSRPAIVVPVRGGRQGHPVLWPCGFFAAIRQLTGDVGARELLTRHASEVRVVDLDTDAIFQDVDTEQQLAQSKRA
jgi:molybdenum cofactor cytidylyltransferase